MVCKKCGYELTNDVAFCPSCGAKCESSPSSTTTIQNSVIGNTLPVAIGSKEKLIYIEAVILLISILFLNIASFHLWTDTDSENYSIFFEAGKYQVIFNLIYIISLALVIYQIAKKKNKTWYFIPAIITDVLSIIWIIFENNIIHSAIDVYVPIDLNVSLSFIGWVFVILVIASLILSIKIIHDMKKANR